MEIKVEYTPYEEGSTVSFSQYTGINVKGKDGDKSKSKPRVIIGQYTVDPQIVRAGDEFDLEIGFTNTHSSKQVQNMKATLKINEKASDSSTTVDTGTVFTPVSGQSNMFYVSEIRPGNTIMEKVRMYTVPNANPKTYEVTIEMEYEDDDGEAYKEEARIGIPVQQKTEINIGDVRVEGEAVVGSPVYVVTQVFNTGSTSIKNLMVTVEGAFDKQEANLFVGNFAQGNAEYFEGVIIPTEAGQIQGELVVTYEEITKEKQEVRVPFTMNVMEGMPRGGMDMGMDIPMDISPEATPFYKKPLVWAGIVIGVALAAAGIVILKKRKKRKEMSFDE